MNTAAPTNPYLRHMHHAPYELANLLSELPCRASNIKKTDKDMQLKAEAAAAHASNASSTLLFGLQALGSLMFVAGTNENYSLEQGELADLGCLIRHLANELHAMTEIEQEFDKAEKDSA